MKSQVIFKKKGQYGFTLVELMIVLAIIVVLVAASIPNYGKFQTTMKLYTAARSISSTIRMARSYAVTQRANYKVVVDTTVTPNLISITDNSDVQVGKIFALPRDLNIPNITFTLDADSKYRVIFNATGGLTDQTSDDRRLWIRKATDSTYTTSPLNFKRIVVDSVTGSVIIDETPYP